ncbi:hypothetical protein K1719_034316 [Acacia pycnantha]|nr:hypothetical protein K1719_034316 [Acacia pycnantha]
MACIDILVNWAGGVLTNMVPVVVKVVVKEASYCWKFETLVQDLGVEQKLLESVRKSKEVQVKKARANTGVPSEEIAQKLKEAADLLKKAKEQLEKAEVSPSCCNGAVPNCISRYIVSRKTEKMTSKIKQLKDDLKQKQVSEHRSRLRVTFVPEDFILFETTKKVHDEIITALKENTKKKIGLYGMGGCGKSSMLKLVHKEAQDMEHFDKIAFVEVSDPPNIPEIQQAIANWFDLDFVTETDKHVRATRLSMAFEEGTSYLIILDNVWKMLKFDDIGIPFNKNCKVLLSTRQLEKCNLMSCQQVIHLPLLTKDHAWELFQRHAGAIEEIKREAEEVVRDHCQELPVAITAVCHARKGTEDDSRAQTLYI